MLNYAFEPTFFQYRKMFDETLKRGVTYWPGEGVKKFGLMRGVIVPVRPAEGLLFEYGEVIALNNDGEARKIAATDEAANFFGIVERNASATYGVLDLQVMGMAPRLTLSVFKGGRDGEIAVPVQNINNTLLAANTATALTVGGAVYVRVKAHGTDAPDWSNDTVAYKAGAIVKHSNVLYTCILDHTSSSADANTPGHADAAPRWELGVAPLPVGGIETVDNDETAVWTGAKFSQLVFSPYQTTQYRTKTAPTVMMSAITLD